MMGAAASHAVPEMAGYPGRVSEEQGRAGKPSDTRMTVPWQPKSDLHALMGALDKTLPGSQVDTAKAVINRMAGTVQAHHNALSPDLLQREKSSIASLLLVLGSVAKTLLQSSEARMDSDHDMLLVQQQIRVDILAEIAKEARISQEKALVMNKVLGVVCKIAGAAMVVAGVAGAIFTGGVSLALAVLGAGLMIADEVVQAVTGASFLEQAMAPVTEWMLPHLEDLVHVFTGILEQVGVESSTAQTIATVLAAVIPVLIVLGLMMTGAGGAVLRGVLTMSGAIARVFVRPIQVVLCRLLPQLAREKLRHVASLIANEYSRVFQAIARRVGIPEDPIVRGIHTQRLNLASASAATLLAASSNTMAVGGAVFEIGHARKMATMHLTDTELVLIGDLIADLLSRFQSSFGLGQEFYVQLGNMIQQRTNAASEIMQGIRNASPV